MDERTKLIAEIATQLLIHGYKYQSQGGQLHTQAVDIATATSLATKIVGKAMGTAVNRID